MRVKRTVAVFLAATVAIATLTASPGAAAPSDPNAKLVTALSGVAGGRVLAAVPSVADHDSAAQTAVVDIPRDPEKGVRLTANGQTTTISLPDAVHLHNGVRLANGAVVFRNDNGSAQVAIPTTQNNVQFLTVVEKAGAPEDYTYPVNVPGNSKVVLAEQGGSAAVFDGAKPVAFVAKPWAQASNKNEVPTHFITNGKSLRQHIAHKASGSYPVVADPHVQWYWNGAVITLSRAEMATVAYGGSQALIPLLLIPGVGWGMIVGVLGMAGSAAWAYANHKCFWFWIQTTWPFVPSTGYYDC